MKPGTPWSRKMVNEQLLRVVKDVLAGLNSSQAAPATLSAAAGTKS
jgi:hypothetical protein